MNCQLVNFCHQIHHQLAIPKDAGLKVELRKLTYDLSLKYFRYYWLFNRSFVLTVFSKNALQHTVSYLNWHAEIGDLINIASASFKLSNLKQPLYYKLRPKIITNYDKNLLQITANLIFVKFKIITNYVKFCYKLRQVLQIATLLQITSQQ